MFRKKGSMDTKSTKLGLSVYTTEPSGNPTEPSGNTRELSGNTSEKQVAFLHQKSPGSTMSPVRHGFHVSVVR